MWQHTHMNESPIAYISTPRDIHMRVGVSHCLYLHSTYHILMHHPHPLPLSTQHMSHIDASHSPITSIYTAHVTYWCITLTHYLYLHSTHHILMHRKLIFEQFNPHAGALFSKFSKVGSRVPLSSELRNRLTFEKFHKRLHGGWKSWKHVLESWKMRGFQILRKCRRR